MKNTPSIRNYAIFGLISVAIIIGAAFLWISYRRNLIASMDDSERYLINFVDLLGDQWMTIYDIEHDLDDFRGDSLSIMGRSLQQTRNSQNPLAFIQQAVIVYSDESAAIERYTLQEERIFHSSQNRRVSDQSGMNTSPNAQNQRIQCTDYASDSDPNIIVTTNCLGLFRYANYIVYLNIFPRRDATTYMTADDLEIIFGAVDEMMSELVR